MLLGAATAALAQAGATAPLAPTGPRFEIRRFVFDGATLLSRRRLDEVTRPYRGRNRSFADVERALEAVERAYADAGYNAVRALPPEQTLERGEVRFRIVEAKIGRVNVEGNKHFSAANVRASVPSLVPGAAPNVKAIDRSLRVANQNPAKHEAVVLRSAAREATVDATIQVEDQSPRRASIALDNSGTPQTGMYRLGLGYQGAKVDGAPRKRS